MAPRVLSFVAATAFLCGCPHDWSAFERVPGEGAIAGESSSTEPPPASSSASGTGGSDPVVFAQPSAEHPTLVVADGEGVVFLTREGSVMACPHDKCDPIGSLASAQRDVRSIAVFGTWAAWSARGENVVRRTTRRPGGVIEQVYEDDGLLAVAVTASKVYFSVQADFAFGSPEVRACTPGIDCGDFDHDVLAHGVVTDLLMSGGDAFWIEAGNVFGCALATCEADADKKTLLAAESAQPIGLAADDANVYFVTPADGGTIRAVARGGSMARTIATGVGSDARITATKRSVWFANAGQGTLGRAPVAGGAITIVAHDLARPTSVAAGGDHVYVACEGDGRLLRWRQEP